MCDHSEQGSIGLIPIRPECGECPDGPASAAASRNAAGTALRASMADPRSEADIAIAEAMDAALEDAARPTTRGEYSPDDDHGYGDRIPADRTPERLAERRLKVLEHIGELAAKLSDLASSIARGDIDSESRVDHVRALQLAIERSASGIGFVSVQLAKDMLLTDSERHRAAVGGSTAFANSDRFNGFNGSPAQAAPPACSCDPLAPKHSTHRGLHGWLVCARCGGRIG